MPPTATVEQAELPAALYAGPHTSLWAIEELNLGPHAYQAKRNRLESPT